MRPDNEALTGKVALITGAARRIGAAIARCLHGAGMDVVLHYRGSEAAAKSLQQDLETVRAGSTLLLQADLLETSKLPGVIERVAAAWGRLDVLVNNASSFYPTPLGQTDEAQWEDLMGTNLKAPFFLAQAAAPLLRSSRGLIVNLTDIHAERPLKGHAVYCMAKAGNVMMVKALARELGPEVRVNGIAPGAILWPEGNMDEKNQEAILSRTALQRAGRPEDIAQALLFLVRDAGYITGQIIVVDGGRGIHC